MEHLDLLLGIKVYIILNFLNYLKFSNIKTILH